MHVLLLLSLLSCWCASTLALPAQYYSADDAAQHFEDFIKKFEKHYIDNEEKTARFEIFKSNLEKINRSNNASSHAIFGITQFSDQTREEFLHRFAGLRTDEPPQLTYCGNVVNDGNVPDANAPESFDWRSRNVVSPVKNQGQCGSCYAFSTIAHLESQYAMKYGQIIDLSEQQIVDCSTLTYGCGGGFMSDAMLELKRLGGSMSEADYPYEETSGSCQSDPNKAAVKISSCSSYSLTSQEKLKQLLYQVGPVAIVLEAEALQQYQGGVLADTGCIGDLNHAVLLVGYGIENGMPYWLLKNSWGTTFGEEGFFKLERSDNPSGACGMLNDMMATGVVQ